MRAPTPLEPAPPALARGRRVLLRREDVHELGAFKWRGALPVLEEYAHAGATGVVTASTGNHGAATAWAARRLGMEAVVFAPEGATRAKLERIERLGATLSVAGADFDEAKEAAAGLARGRGLPFFEDGAEPAQYDGYAAIGREILAALGGEEPATVVVPVGNGALIGGVAKAVEGRPGVRLVGVVAKEAPVMALSWQAGEPVECDRCDTVADGLAVRVAIPYAVERIRTTVDEMLTVSERALAESVRAFARSGIRVEAAAAAPLAALDRLAETNGPIVLVVTGRNVDDDLLARMCERPESFAP
jgi:threonine dehydratase